MAKRGFRATATPLPENPFILMALLREAQDLLMAFQLLGIELANAAPTPQDQARGPALPGEVVDKLGAGPSRPPSGISATLPSPRARPWLGLRQVPISAPGLMEYLEEEDREDMERLKSLQASWCRHQHDFDASLAVFLNMWGL